MALFDLDNLTRNFGVERRWKDQNDIWRYEKAHLGQDYAETYGNDKVVATRSGRVIRNYWSSIYGWVLDYVTPDGVEMIGHMFDEKSKLKVGDPVYEGKTVLGYTGASANNASGNHIHIGSRVNGQYVNPRKYIVPSAASAGGGSKPIQGVEVQGQKEFQSYAEIGIASEARAQTKIKKGGWWRLWHEKNAKPTNLASGTGGAGSYVFILHFDFDDLFEGDYVEVKLVWETKGVESSHYVYRIHGSKTGVVKDHVTFARRVAAGQSVWLDAKSPKERTVKWGASVLNFVA